MNHILFDSTARQNLLPFTHTRPVADIRCGILTMRERWEFRLGTHTASFTEAYLSDLYPSVPDAGSEDTLYLNGAVFADAAITTAVKELAPGEVLSCAGIVIAARLPLFSGSIAHFNEHIQDLPFIEYAGALMTLANVWDIFSLNEKAIAMDYPLLTTGRESAPIPEGVTAAGKHQLFIEPGANIYAGCVINAATGPVYIGKDTEILEGTLMRGPVAICDQSVTKMGAKIYGATTLGPGCKVGGEINNAVFFANSNKSHDGYLGNAVIGEWCNLGADTNCSNLKNNYDIVKIRHEATGQDVSTGLIFCGLMMGDHSKCGINTMFNTGTVVGVSCNIYGGGFPDKFIPSFSWGGSEGFVSYNFEKAMATAKRVYARRGKTLSQEETDMYRYLYDAAPGIYPVAH